MTSDVFCSGQIGAVAACDAAALVVVDMDARFLRDADQNRRGFRTGARAAKTTEQVHKVYGWIAKPD